MNNCVLCYVENIYFVSCILFQAENVYIMLFHLENIYLVLFRVENLYGAYSFGEGLLALFHVEDNFVLL